MADRKDKAKQPEKTIESALPTRLGRNLAARRKEMSLTQAQVAERLGIDTETLSRFERGRHVPSLLTLERLAEVLGSTCAALLDETVKPPSPGATIIDTWLAGLNKRDASFAKEMLKAWCDHLTKR